MTIIGKIILFFCVPYLVIIASLTKENSLLHQLKPEQQQNLISVTDPSTSLTTRTLLPIYQFPYTYNLGIGRLIQNVYNTI